MTEEREKSGKEIDVEEKIYNNNIKENDRVLHQDYASSVIILRFIEQSKKFKLFWGSIGQMDIGRYRFNDVFDNNMKIKSEMVPQIVKEYDINLCIIKSTDKFVISTLKNQGFVIVSKISDKIVLRKR